MSTDSDEVLIGGVTRQNQIIIGAMIAGIVMFLVIATVFDLTPQPRVGARGGGGAIGPAVPQVLELGEILTWLAVGFAVLGLPLSFIVPYLIDKQIRRGIVAGKGPASQPSLDSSAAKPSESGTLATVYTTQFIVGAAINEGAAFFATVAYLLSKNPIALGVAVLLLVVMVLRFPTTHRVALWIARQEEMLFLERQAAI